MLKDIDYSGKNIATYTCDRCHVRMTKTNRKGVFITNNKGIPIKKWDLCLRCYKSLELGMKKGTKNEEERSN